MKTSVKFALDKVSQLLLGEGVYMTEVYPDFSGRSANDTQTMETLENNQSTVVIFKFRVLVSSSVRTKNG